MTRQMTSLSAFHITAFATLALSLSACGQPKEPPLPPEAIAARTEASQAAIVASEYVGRWVGPEGTSLEVTAREHDYIVSITSLNGPRDFTGTVEGDGIKFVRDDKTYIVRRGTGMETGMKWLLDKRDCVIVETGEGYCRD